jgi:hypothetical protein
MGSNKRLNDLKKTIKIYKSQITKNSSEKQFGILAGLMLSLDILEGKSKLFKDELTTISNTSIK